MQAAFFSSAILFIFILHLSAAAAKPQAELIAIEGQGYVVALQYNTENNFLKKNVYQPFHLDRCYVHPDLNAVLQKLLPILAEKKLQLVLWDCYRPLEVQKAMWKLVPDSRYVANPKVGSNHNRGIAVDVSLADATGQPLPMPTPFDDFSPKAAPGYPCEATEVKRCANRDLLIQLMGAVGLKPLATEWWHFQLPNAKKYPIVESLNVPQP